MADLDIDFVRAQFPAFTQPDLADWAFFENAGGSYPCRQVVDRLTDFYTRLKVQPYWAFPASREGGERMDDAKRRLADVLGVEEDEVHVGPSTSQNTYVLAQALRGTLRSGDEIVVTDQDHEANSGVWRRLSQEGAVIREWQVDSDTGHLDPSALQALLSERTRLVAFPHVSNVVGEINPVARICAIVREAGAVSMVDGVSGAPHGLPDVGELGADVYLFSAYKTHGPHQGVMVVRRDVVEQFAHQGHYFNEDKVSARFTPAGPDHAQVAALAGMVDYLEALRDHHFGPEAAWADVRGLIARQEEVLAAPLLDYLRARNDVRLIGPTMARGRAPTVAVVHDKPGEALADALVDHRIMAGGGTFYADRVVSAVGVPPEHGVLRLSFLHYTKPSEIDRLIEALDQVL